MGRQEGKSCVGVEERLEVRGAVWTLDMEARRQDYIQARGEAKRAIFKAKNDERKRFCEDLERENDKGNLFRVAKQLVNRNRDVVGTNCMKDSAGKIVMEEDKLMEVWRAHYDVLSNEEFTWDREGLTDARPVCGPSERISDIGGGCGYW